LIWESLVKSRHKRLKFKPAALTAAKYEKLFNNLLQQE
jgi:hypothetical protein